MFIVIKGFMVRSKFSIIPKKIWNAIHAANMATVSQDHIGKRRAQSN